MTSILTNAAATAALQTLRSLDRNLAEAQNQVSSGRRIDTASDNAAYWSIATTMRSDGGAISAVSDALGLGAATADVAYAATQSIVDVLTAFKTRLVAARESGVDKSKIQEELSQLNGQAESIVASASFNGINWLATNAPTHIMLTETLATDVVGSFVRSASGSVAVKTLEVDLKKISMLNAGGGGMLQKDLPGVNDIGGFLGTNINSIAHQGHESHAFTGPATFDLGDYIAFEVLIDAGIHSPGTTFSALRIDKTIIDTALGTTDGVILNASQMRTVLQQVFDNNAVPATAFETLFSGTTPGEFEIGSKETSGHPGSSINVTGVTSFFNGVYPTGFALGLEDVPVRNHDNMYPEDAVRFTEPFNVSELAQIFFDVQVGPGALTTFTVDRAAVDLALGTDDGYVGDVDALAAVLSSVTVGSGLALTVSGSTIVVGADQTIYPEAGNRAARVYVGNVHAIPPWTLDFDLDEVDITKSDFTVDEYITGIEYMLKRTISSASGLGSLQARIDMQSAFAETLVDSIEKGVGRLVDADMNEASTRLKALQTQGQLAIQSLQIANTSSENILSLFR